MSKEYCEEIPLNGSTIAQFQSRAVKAFAALGWKFENFSKIGVSATIPKKYKNDNSNGKLDLTFMGSTCEVSCSLATPPMMFASKMAKNNVTPFMKQFEKEVSDPSADNADDHEKAMTNALMKANRIEQEKIAAKEAKAATIKRIKMAIRCTIPLALGLFGVTVDGGRGFLVGVGVGLIVNEVLIFLFRILTLGF